MRVIYSSCNSSCLILALRVGIVSVLKGEGLKGMKAIIGQKIGMSQMFSSKGEVIPVTLVAALPNIITLRRTLENNGYTAVQLALPRREKDEQKPAKKQSTARARKEFAHMCEFRGDVHSDVTVVDVGQFQAGDVVHVTGTSKGKGFAGVVKRHGFKGGPASHGHRHVLRRPGSIGSRFPQHTRKGKRMAGRMGTDRVTIKNLSIVSVDSEQHVLIIRGAVPGTRGSIVEIRSDS